MIRYLPNAISITRMVLVVPVVWALATHRYEIALGLFAVAGISDALDGAIAKRQGWVSPLGAFLDPAADKLLVLGTYTTFAVEGQIPWWLLGIIVGRDLIIVCGAGIYRWRRGPFEIQPALTSKIATGVLITVGVALVIEGIHPYLGADGRTVCVIVLAVALIISWLDYQVTWGLKYLGLHGSVRRDAHRPEALEASMRESRTGGD
ncbi:MAG: CDP-alcohol phosphatidyltransferase family protein [Gammaproteobacteria bacterium]